MIAYHYKYKPDYKQQAAFYGPYTCVLQAGDEINSYVIFEIKYGPTGEGNYYGIGNLGRVKCYFL